MLIILAFIILFHLAAAILCFVATIHNVSINQEWTHNCMAANDIFIILNNNSVSSPLKAWWLVTPAGRDVIFTDLWYSCNATCVPVENSHTTDAGKTVYSSIEPVCVCVCKLLFLYCDHLFSSFPSAYLQAVQATMILASILCCVSFFVFILQLFKIQQGERFLFTAVIQLLACEWHTHMLIFWIYGDFHISQDQHTVNNCGKSFVHTFLRLD